MDVLLNHQEPAIRYKYRVNVLGESHDTRDVKRLQAGIPRSDIARSLLVKLNTRGIHQPAKVYSKWQGAHWVMAALADIGYPRGDLRLVPVRDQLQARWLAPHFFEEFVASTRAACYRRQGVPVMQGRHRRCASQQSNALWSILKLGLENDDTPKLAERLLHWQWPDGGWNCDKNPAASHSSFMESILPLRALSLYGHTSDCQKAIKAARDAAEIFLKRELYLGQHSGLPIKVDFQKLHYPLYWHYDFLHGLKVMAECGLINDPRCKRALDLLEAKRLPDGGWPAEAKYYRVSDDLTHGNETANWGGTGRKKMNPWVTVDALYVLRAAGRLSVQ